ncbi:MAG: hypothetical protein JW991_03855 [Candidatus Pacebacteria bacterium]|nr:hypothetical protein [Candidatus Paceibacterota bacterium]
MDFSALILDLIAKLFSPFIKILKWFYKKLPFELNKKRKLGVVESSWQEHTWEYAKHRDEDVVALHTHWQITNTLPYNLTVLNAFLVKPEKIKGSVMIKNYKSDIWGHYPLPSGYTTNLNITFVIDKKYIKKPTQILKTKIDIQDPIGRKHRINDVFIKPIHKRKTKKEHLLVEDSSKIRDDIEKQVVAVLKNEVEQYRARGRKEGRLGTVEWPRGSIEWRGADEKIKYLYENSNKGNVTSEHVSALLTLYSSLSKTNKDKIINALVKRIDKKTEYRDIGYLIIFFLFEVKRLKIGLDATLKKLKGDKANAFGDVLRMLDFLLAFRYEEFERPELDEIEAFVYSTEEHSFKIKERINAIRVKNMISKPKQDKN